MRSPPGWESHCKLRERNEQGRQLGTGAISSLEKKSSAATFDQEKVVEPQTTQFKLSLSGENEIISIFSKVVLKRWSLKRIIKS